MKKLTGVLVPVLLVGVLAGGMAYMRQQIDQQTHHHEEEQSGDTHAAKLLKAQSNKNKVPLTPGRQALIETNRGNIRIVLYEKNAPRTTSHFVRLVKAKFYDNTTFHRVVPGFVIQGGQPDDLRTAGNVDLELAEALKHDKGAVAMARADDPNSATCEFYITLADHHELDDKYAVFGKVLEGMDVAQKIREGNRVARIRMIDAPSSEASAKEATPDGHSKPK